MPAKYHITTHHTPPVHKPIGKYGIVDWREDCSACHNCVKRECAYSVYDDERDRLRGAPDYVDYLYECKGCLCCVQSCTKGLLSWDVNPEYAALGDEVWTPDIISSTWYQAETGSIPVSGAGYPGRFRGPGFDSILTDMSEIVRPTRDGIHGREYISTAVDIGRKPLRLEFDGSGKLLTECPTLVEVPIPIIFNTMPWHRVSPRISEAIVAAAEKLGTFALTDEPAEQARIAQWLYGHDVVARIAAAKRENPDLVAIVKLALGANAAQRALELAKKGVDAIHLFADWRGYVDGQHITLAVRDVHKAFVDSGIRDGVTLIASGGISMAEHVVKMVLCGADLVAIDLPLMIALECRICRRCSEGLECPLNIDSVDREYAVQRIVNLMGAWHSQLIEMMGAMGIREARRLRGEVGRAMFFDDLERECFGPIFGARKTEVA